MEGVEKKKNRNSSRQWKLHLEKQWSHVFSRGKFQFSNGSHLPFSRVGKRTTGGVCSFLHCRQTPAYGRQRERERVALEKSGIRRIQFKVTDFFSSCEEVKLVRIVQHTKENFFFPEISSHEVINLPRNSGWQYQSRRHWVFCLPDRTGKFDLPPEC